MSVAKQERAGASPASTAPPPGTAAGPTRLRIDPAAVHRTIAAGLAVVGVGAAIAAGVLHGGAYETLPAGRAIVSWLHLDSEQALPAVFSAVLIAAAAGLLLLMTLVAPEAHSGRRHRRRWRGLAVVLALLALDELMGVHESISAELRSALGVDGLLHHAWILPYLGLAVVVAALMIRPLLDLPGRTRGLVLAGGGCYVLGAAGAKVVDSLLDGAGPAAFEILVTVEELLEIGGMWLLVAAVLRELAGRAATVELAPARPAEPPPG